MAIVNVTPDSFSGDGLSARALDETLRHCEQLIVNGAHILDIGGESTRPGAEVVSPEEETHRVVPLVEALSSRFQVPLSVDTTKAVVARSALEAGADIINDISGATADEQMFNVMSASNCGCILMHRRGTPQTMGWSQAVPGEQPANVIAEILQFWKRQVEAAQAHGIEHERIALDAGFGFGKSLEENLEILRRGRELSALGYPNLSATSRKSTIGRILNDAPVDERAWGTAATVAIAIANGADMVRVHDVREMAQVAHMTDAIVRRQ